MPALLLALVGLLWNVARAVLPSIIGKILITLGLSVAVSHFVLPDAIAFVQSHMGGITGDMVGFLAFINVDKMITMILSAAIARTAGRAVLSAKVLT